MNASLIPDGGQGELSICVLVRRVGSWVIKYTARQTYPIGPCPLAPLALRMPRLGSLDREGRGSKTMLACRERLSLQNALF
jgi:hypothetical protein